MNRGQHKGLDPEGGTKDGLVVRLPQLLLLAVRPELLLGDHPFDLLVLQATYSYRWPPLGFAAAGQVSLTHPFIIAKNAYLFL
jgi:hypothetical protein